MNNLIPVITIILFTTLFRFLINSNSENKNKRLNVKKINLENKKTLIILILICFVLSCVCISTSSEMYEKSDIIEKTVQVNHKGSEYILKSVADKNNIPYKKNSTITINGKKYCRYYHISFYAKSLLCLSLFFTMGLVCCVGKFAIIFGQEIGNKKKE